MIILDVLAATPTDVNTDGAIGWLGGKIVPILLAFLGVVFISRASKGNISGVLTGGAIAVIGLAFFGGAGVLLAFGDNIARMIVTGGAP